LYIHLRQYVFILKIHFRTYLETDTSDTATKMKNIQLKDTNVAMLPKPCETPSVTDVSDIETEKQDNVTEMKNKQQEDTTAEMVHDVRYKLCVTGVTDPKTETRL